MNLCLLLSLCVVFSLCRHRWGGLTAEALKGSSSSRQQCFLYGPCLSCRTHNEVLWESIVAHCFDRGRKECRTLDHIFICFCLTEWWYFKFLQFLLPRVGDRQGDWVSASSGLFSMEQLDQSWNGPAKLIFLTVLYGYNVGKNHFCGHVLVLV